MLYALNALGIILIGSWLVFKKRRLLLTGLSLGVTLCFLLLSQLTLWTSFTLAEVTVSPFDLLSLVLFPLWLPFMGRIKRTGYHLLVFISFAVVWAMVGFVLQGGMPLRMVYSLAVFAGTLLCAVYASSLKAWEADSLLSWIQLMGIGLAFIAVASVAASVVVGEALDWEKQNMYRAVTPVGTAIATGAILVLILPYYLYLALEERSLFGVSTFLLAWLAALLTGSRAINAAALLGLVTVMVWFVIRGRGGLPKRVSILCLLALMGASGVFYLSQRQDTERATARLSQEVGMSEGDFLRFSSLQKGIDLIEERPISGHVPGQTYRWFLEEYHEANSVNYFLIGGGLTLIEPHNLYLMMGVDYGLLVLGAFVLVFVSMLTRLYRASKYNPALFPCAVGILMFLMQAMWSSHLLINPRVAIIFWAFAGASSVLAHDALRRQRSREVIEERNVTTL